MSSQPSSGALHSRSSIGRSLTRRLLTRVVVTSAVVMGIAAAVGFYFSYQNAIEAQITELQYDKTQRVEREAVVFRQAEQTADLLGKYFVEAYARYANKAGENGRDWVAQFNAMHEETEPGVFRLRKEFFTGTDFGDQRIRHMSSFIGRSDAPLDEERKRRISIAVELLQRFAAAWQELYENTHISMPENALVQYSRNQPWGRQADHNLDMTRYAVVRSTLQAYNPERIGRWTGLYYDLSSQQWVVTYQQPVDKDGVHLGTPSHDVQLADIFARLIDSFGGAAEHAIINTQRQLIAASPALLEGHQNSGIVDLEALNEPLYLNAWERLESQSTPQQFILPEHDVLVVAEQIPGPDWWYVTSYPLAEIKQAALGPPMRFLLVGLAFALALLGILYIFVSQQIARPLKELAGFAQAVGKNRFDEVSQIAVRSEYNKSEIGLLIRSMKEMAGRILKHKTQLEEEVELRTSELAVANKQLDKMAHIDGLTKVLNRRAFDRDLQAALARENDQSGRRYALLLADVDYFKLYNDSYGHVAGDQALQNIAQQFEQTCPHTAYRFGGEELACLVRVRSAEEALRKAEQLRSGVESLNISHHDAPLGVLTVSIGVTLLQPHEPAATAISRADKHLYSAKKHARNCVCGL